MAMLDRCPTCGAVLNGDKSCPNDERTAERVRPDATALEVVVAVLERDAQLPAPLYRAEAVVDALRTEGHLR